MKANRIVVLMLQILFFAVFAEAQQTVYYQSNSPELQNARDLYQARNYISALSLFDRIAAQSEVNSDLQAEATFYKVLCGLKLDNGNAEEQIADFMKQFPESSYRNRALFEQAVYQFDKKKYSAVIKTFTGVNQADLNTDELTYFYYLRGYSYFELEKMDAATSAFDKIKNGNSM